MTKLLPARTLTALEDEYDATYHQYQTDYTVAYQEYLLNRQRALSHEINLRDALGMQNTYPHAWTVDEPARKRATAISLLDSWIAEDAAAKPSAPFSFSRWLWNILIQPHD